MSGVDRVEVALGDLILVFDDDVLEIFGAWAFSGAHLSSMRVHVRQLTVETSGPDRKGRFELKLVGPSKFVSLSWQFESETEWGSIRPLLDALRSSGATAP